MSTDINRMIDISRILMEGQARSLGMVERLAMGPLRRTDTDRLCFLTNHSTYMEFRIDGRDGYFTHSARVEEPDDEEDGFEVYLTAKGSSVYRRVDGRHATMILAIDAVMKELGL